VIEGGGCILSVLEDRLMKIPARRGAVVAAFLALALAGPLAAQPQPDRADHDAIYRIKEEGFQRSQVMDITSYLTDIYGPRLTGSPNYSLAADWAVKKMTEWGLAGVKREPWGPFGRGWSNERFYAHALAPQAYPIIGYPKAWSAGTDGPIAGQVVLVTLDEDKDFETHRGTLRGKFVLLGEPRALAAQFDPPGSRYTDQQLEALATENAMERRPPYRGPDPRVLELTRRRMQFLEREGALAVIDVGRKGDGGTVVIAGVLRGKEDAVGIPQVTFAAEHYGRIARTLAKKIPVTIELNIKNTFHDAQQDSFNIIGEIPGTDLAEEIVLIGGHFDSWHAGTGATDNAAGSAVMMEAMRILTATGLQPRRTIRIGLWSGEEQGLLGSRAYVKQHFADRDTMALKPAHARFSAYFNVDNGTGAIRGVYLQGNEAVAPIFSAWMAPFHNLGMTTLSIRNTGGTDHLAFDAVGLPGFQFIQDPIEYDTRTHHSSMDTYERIQPQAMMKNAVIVASFAYHAAMRDEKLPRKPLPKPQPPRPATTTTAGR
jgi:carboxypeptidase Q